MKKLGIVIAVIATRKTKKVTRKLKRKNHLIVTQKKKLQLQLSLQIKCYQSLQMLISQKSIF